MSNFSLGTIAILMEQLLRWLAVHLVGCPHRLNLAIKTYFEQGPLQLPVEKVEALMTKLSTTKMTALLRHNAASNCRVAKKRQVTRWQGTNSMIK